MSLDSSTRPAIFSQLADSTRTVVYNQSPSLEAGPSDFGKLLCESDVAIDTMPNVPTLFPSFAPSCGFGATFVFDTLSPDDRVLNARTQSLPKTVKVTSASPIKKVSSSSTLDRNTKEVTSGSSESGMVAADVAGLNLSDLAISKTSSGLAAAYLCGPNAVVDAM